MSAAKSGAKHEREKVLHLDSLTFDIEKSQVSRKGTAPHHLTPIERRLLALFMHHPGRVFSHAFLMREVWGTDYLDDTRTLDVHICWLRRKIEPDPYHPIHLITVRGLGYYFNGFAPEDPAHHP